MGLDIRLPIGMMFGLVGLLLTAYGFMTRGNEVYAARSMGININLVWGCVLIVFSALMLVFALRDRKSQSK